MQDWFKRFRELSAAVRAYNQAKKPDGVLWDCVRDAAGLPAKCKADPVDVRELIRGFETR